MDQIVIPREATAKQVLAAIDRWAGEVLAPDPYTYQPTDRERKNLWSVLSAMRGPDSGDWRLKDQTTAVLRAAALPNLAQHGGGIVAASYVVADRLQQLVEYLPAPGETAASAHFIDHIRMAAEVLAGF